MIFIIVTLLALNYFGISEKRIQKSQIWELLKYNNLIPVKFEIWKMLESFIKLPAHTLK